MTNLLLPDSKVLVQMILQPLSVVADLFAMPNHRRVLLITAHSLTQMRCHEEGAV